MKTTSKKAAQRKKRLDIDYHIEHRTDLYWAWIDESGQLPGNADHLWTFREGMRRFLEKES